MTDNGLSLNNEDQIRDAQMLTQRKALKLEIIGFTRRGRSVASIIKSQYGLRGNNRTLYAKFTRLINEKMPGMNLPEDDLPNG